MSLSKRDKAELNAILSELGNVERLIEDARDQLIQNYRTVGGHHFYTPLTELADRIQKVRSTLRKID
jgi:hypothetical protein